jgi:hypothetical protein
VNKLFILFRVFPEGDVIALFPNEAADLSGNITSYQRIGQHGAASPELVSELPEATPTEAAQLLKELISIYKPKRVSQSGVLGDGVLFHGVEYE